MRFSFLILFLSLSEIAFSQVSYLDSITTVFETTHTYKKAENIELKFDFYKPQLLKNKTPVIVYVHGGGFSGGKRNEDYIKNYGNYMAQHGYAVVSISYQLTMQNLGFGCTTKSTDKIRAFNKASEDISFAVKYILENKNKFNIDEDKIILAGSSAGAEAVLNLAYVYNNKILPKRFKFAGVISMADAIISLKNINNKTAIPTQLFHGTKDKLVPYNIAPHHYCKKKDKGYLILYGSKAIANKLNKLNEPYYIYTIKKGDHSWAGKPMYECVNDMIDFIYFDVLKKRKRQIDITM